MVMELQVSILANQIICLIPILDFLQIDLIKPLQKETAVSAQSNLQMSCTNLEVLLAESLVRVNRLGLGQLLDRRRSHGLNTTA